VTDPTTGSQIPVPARGRRINADNRSPSLEFGRIPSMKKVFVDRETGWAASRETRIHPGSWMAVVEETVTDPKTGKVFRSSRVATYRRSITEWVQAIEETKEDPAHCERANE
jgi:hypothetical protein